MKLKAPKEKVLVQKDDIVTEIAGLELSKGARIKVQRATIVDVGENGEDWMKEGVCVFLPSQTGINVDYDGKNYHSVLNREIYAYLEDD